jgi:hypothetical protein
MEHGEASGTERARKFSQGKGAWQQEQGQAKNLPEEREVIFMAKGKDIKKKGKRAMKGKSEKAETNASCCYVVDDPCGCYVDLCGCYDPCCC